MLLVACGEQQQEGTPPPPTVEVATPLQRDVVDWDDYTGRFEASQDVEVRPRVTGVITAIHFRNGQNVVRGQRLFTIDPRPYRAALQQAQAQVSRAQAALTNARQVTARSRQLLSAQAVSREELETNVAAERTAAAELAAAQAAVAAAELNLSFTEVRAPFSGRVSDRRVSLGDTVAEGDTLLTRIVSIDPIWFTFEGAESLYLKNRRQGANGSQPSAGPVEIQLADENGYNWNGRMEFLDNAIDPQSGTIRAHAVVRNPNGFLTPGMFGRARLPGSGTYRAMLIPDTAIMTDQTRRLVYVIGRDRKVVQRPVELGPIYEGLRIVREGLAPTDLVVLNGQSRLQPGMTVVPKRVAIQANPQPNGQSAPSQPAAAEATAAR